MKERIRIRLRDAVPLESADYRIALSVALGVDSQKNQRRYALFELSRAVLNVPAVCVGKGQKQNESTVWAFMSHVIPKL